MLQKFSALKNFPDLELNNVLDDIPLKNVNNHMVKLVMKGYYDSNELGQIFAVLYRYRLSPDKILARDTLSPNKAYQNVNKIIHILMSLRGESV